MCKPSGFIVHDESTHTGCLAGKCVRSRRASGLPYGSWFPDGPERMTADIGPDLGVVVPDAPRSVTLCQGLELPTDGRHERRENCNGVTGKTTAGVGKGRVIGTRIRRRRGGVTPSTATPHGENENREGNGRLDVPNLAGIGSTQRMGTSPVEVVGGQPPSLPPGVVPGSQLAARSVEGPWERDPTPAHSM